MLPIVLCFLCWFAVDVGKAGPSLEHEDAFCKSEVLPRVTQGITRYISKSVQPCDNFYQYACGKSFINIRDMVEARIQAFATEFHKQEVEVNYDPNDVKNKAKLHYQMCMDMDTRRKRGVDPLLDHVKALTGFDVVRQEFVAENFDWLKAVAMLAKEGSIALFAAFYDRENITLYKDSALAVLNKSESERILIETGVNADVARQAAEELELFGINLNSVEFDQKAPFFETLTFQELQSKIPDIDWEKYFVIADGYLPSQQIMLSSPFYFSSLRRKLDQTSPKAIANYIFLRAVMASYLTLDGRYNEVIESLANPSGKKNDPDPESWCLSVASYWINEAVDSAFVKEYFSGSNKTEAIELVELLKKAVVDSHWSNAKTKEEILKDLAGIYFQVGYPDYILSDDTINENYKDLKIVPGKYYESQQNAMRFQRLKTHREFNSTNPIWSRSPHYVNVYNDGNKITIPAGQFQPPYYHYCFPKAINFGAVGTLIANEIVRKIGRTYSCSTSNSSSSYVPDTESVRIAYKAYTDWVKETLPTKNIVLPELKDVSDKQLFFIAYAHCWCGSNRPETEQLIREALSNLTEFAEAFGCLAGSNMNPEKKCSS